MKAFLKLSFFGFIAGSLFLSSCHAVAAKRDVHSYALEMAHLDLERSSVSRIMDLSHFLKRKELKRLERLINGNSLSVDLETQLLIASSVPAGHSTKEIATRLLNKWKLGSEPNHMGGILIVVVLEEHRIELELSDSIAHIFDSDWCHEMLYTNVVPLFRQDRYLEGLELILEEIIKKLKSHQFQRGSSSRDMAKQRRRRRKLFGLAGLYGGVASAILTRKGPQNDEYHADDSNGPPPLGPRREPPISIAIQSPQFLENLAQAFATFGRSKTRTNRSWTSAKKPGSIGGLFTPSRRAPRVNVDDSSQESQHESNQGRSPRGRPPLVFLRPLQFDSSRTIRSQVTETIRHRQETAANRQRFGRSSSKQRIENESSNDDCQASGQHGGGASWQSSSSSAPLSKNNAKGSSLASGDNGGGASW